MIVMVILSFLVYLAVVEVDASGLIILILRASIYSSQKIGAAHSHSRLRFYESPAKNQNQYQ